jgi:tetratricopeptide (TPR) repeat protein
MAWRGALAAAIVVVGAEVVVTRSHLPVWKDTETLYAHMLKLAPQSAALHNNLAYELKDMKRYDDAIDRFRKALEMKPGDLISITNLGEALARAGKRDEAIALYQRTLREAQSRNDPSDLNSLYFIHCNLGALLAETGKTEEATEHYRVARLLKPDGAEAMTNYANGLYAQGRLEEALKIYQEALEYRPDIADTHNSLAACFDELNMPEQAIRHYMLAVNLNPDYFGARLNLASRLARSGIAEEAVVHAREAVRLEPKNVEALFLLAQLLSHQRQNAEAVDLLKRILVLDPGYLPASDLLKRILNPTSKPASSIFDLSPEPQHPGS